MLKPKHKYDDNVGRTLNWVLERSRKNITRDVKGMELYIDVLENHTAYLMIPEVFKRLPWMATNTISDLVKYNEQQQQQSMVNEIIGIVNKEFNTNTPIGLSTAICEQYFGFNRNLRYSDDLYYRLDSTLCLYLHLMGIVEYKQEYDSHIFGDERCSAILDNVASQLVMSTIISGSVNKVNNVLGILDTMTDMNSLRTKVFPEVFSSVLQNMEIDDIRKIDIRFLEHPIMAIHEDVQYAISMIKLYGEEK